MNDTGTIIKKWREEKELPIETLASILNIGSESLISIEQGTRRLTKAQVVELSTFFKKDVNELLIALLSDRLMQYVEDDERNLGALKMAEDRVHYKTKKLTTKINILQTIQSALDEDGRVSAAWVFGSFARGEEQANSDIDIMIELKEDKQYSMFDVLDIAHLLENSIKHKIDVVEKDCLKPFAQQTALKDIIKIYG